MSGLIPQNIHFTSEQEEDLDRIFDELRQQYQDGTLTLPDDDDDVSGEDMGGNTQEAPTGK